MSQTRQIRNLALIGFMGTGKSSVGRQVAAHLNYQFLDTDETIESRAGKSITRIFAEEGEAKFREYERNLVAELAQASRVIFSTGGGLAANEANLASLKQHALVVCLWASPESIWQRVRHQSHRPLLQDSDPLGKIRRLLEQREPFYKQADVLVNTEMRGVKEVVQHVEHQFQLALAGQKAP